MIYLNRWTTETSNSLQVQTSCIQTRIYNFDLAFMQQSSHCQHSFKTLNEILIFIGNSESHLYAVLEEELYVRVKELYMWLSLSG